MDLSAQPIWTPSPERVGKAALTRFIGARFNYAENLLRLDGDSPAIIFRNERGVAIAQERSGDVRIVLFVRLREGLAFDDSLRDKICGVIRNNTSPRHVPAKSSRRRTCRGRSTANWWNWRTRRIGRQALSVRGPRA